MLAFYLTLVETPEDKDYFEEIYKTYKSVMFAAAEMLLHDKDLAEDAVHDAFVKVSQNIAMFRDYSEAHLKASLITITRNRALNVAKSESRFVYEDIWQEGKSLVYLTKDECDVENEFIEKTNRRELERAVASLSIEDRDLITLYYVQRLPGKDIAKMFNMK